jgi:undecaprenyl-diphosphatase
MWAAERAEEKDLASQLRDDDDQDGAALAVVRNLAQRRAIAAGLFRNIDRPSAARFSFLLSTPAIAGAAASALHHLLKQGGIPADMRTPFALGIVISGISGCAVIAFFLKYLKNNTLRFFIYYRLVFGIIVIALALFRRPAG